MQLACPRSAARRGGSPIAEHAQPIAPISLRRPGRSRRATGKEEGAYYHPESPDSDRGRRTAARASVWRLGTPADGRRAGRGGGGGELAPASDRLRPRAPRGRRADGRAPRALQVQQTHIQENESASAENPLVRARGGLRLTCKSFISVGLIVTRPPARAIGGARAHPRPVGGARAHLAMDGAVPPPVRARRGTPARRGVRAPTEAEAEGFRALRAAGRRGGEEEGERAGEDEISAGCKGAPPSASLQR